MSDTLDTITKHATYEDMERIQRFADKFPDVVLCILVHLKDSSCWRSEKYIKWLIDRYPDEVPFNACRDLIQAKPVLLWIFAQRIIERLEFALNRVNYIERDPVLVEVGISGVTWHLNLAEIMPNHSSRDEIWNKTIPEAIIVQKLTNGVMKKIDENFPLELKRKEG